MSPAGGCRPRWPQRRRCATPRACEIRLWQARRRKGAQLVNAPGAWNFSNLRSADLEGARRFYGELFRLALRRPGVGDRDQRPRLRRPPRGHRRPRHPHPPGRGAGGLRGRHRRARARGRRGTRLVRRADRRRPRRHCIPGRGRSAAPCSAATDTGWTKEAAIRDPQGAVFTASQFAPPDSWE